EPDAMSRSIFDHQTRGPVRMKTDHQVSIAGLLEGEEALRIFDREALVPQVEGQAGAAPLEERPVQPSHTARDVVHAAGFGKSLQQQLSKEIETTLVRHGSRGCLDFSGRASFTPERAARPGA